MATSSTQKAINSLTKNYLEEFVSEDNSDKKFAKYARLEGLAAATDMSPENLSVLSKMLIKNDQRMRGIMADDPEIVLGDFMDDVTKMQSKREQNVPNLQGRHPGFGSNEDKLVESVQIMLAKLKESATIPYNEEQG